MKIYISCSYNNDDWSEFLKLKESLLNKGYEITNPQIKNGENVFEQYAKAMNLADVHIAIVTEHYLTSSWTQAELSSAIFSNKKIRVLPVVVGKISTPLYLNDFQHVVVDTLDEVTNSVLREIDKLENGDEKSSLFMAGPSKKADTHDKDEKINLLKSKLRDNQLTLVCGSGISKDLNIPDWNQLLIGILNSAIFNNYEPKNIVSEISAEDLLKQLPQSNLILAKYLRLILRDEFEKKVQNQLYLKYHELQNEGNKSFESEIMKAIVDLARPKRSGKRLESIITFNFDDLIEISLFQHSVKFCSIWEEGQTHDIDSLPIYHVHGFLPYEKFIDNPNLVLSEDSYHSQFIDPYSWSNLIQLNTFSSNICLFIGLSLSDPNLRRLLDISHQRNRRCDHYIIKKKASQDTLTDKFSAMLFEQDANSLGLNVIWCSDYSEIPTILAKISE